MIIDTAIGPMDTLVLEYREGGHENENEKAAWQEWWYRGQLVKRDAQVHLKRGISAVSDTGKLK